MPLYKQSVYKRVLSPLSARALNFGARGFDKSRGQNFLLNPADTRSIARAACPERDRPIVEIGSGPGGLTRALFEEGATRLLAIEPDRRFHRWLEELRDSLSEGLALHILDNDARYIDLPQLSQQSWGTRAALPPLVVGNLPYSAASPILQNLLQGEQDWHALCLMFQREVAMRVCAAPSSKRYGRLSVLVQVKARVTVCHDLPPSAFFPVPQVFSRLLRFLPMPLPVSPIDYEALKRLSAQLFAQRRKKIGTILRKLDDSAYAEQARSAAESVRIDLHARPEEIAPQTWLEWARNIPYKTREYSPRRESSHA